MFLRLLRLGSRGWKNAIVLLVLYFAVSVIYYHIPWSVRINIYKRVPRVNKALMLSGYKTMQGWDDLALFGKDASVPMEKTMRGDQVYGGFPSQGMRLFGRTEMIENRGYTVGYSESLKNPILVADPVFVIPKLY
jgi:hypothetical protein